MLTAHVNVVQSDPLEVRNSAQTERRESSESVELSGPLLLSVGDATVAEHGNLQVTIA